MTHPISFARVAAIFFTILLATFSSHSLASDPDEDSDCGDIVIDKDNGSNNPVRPINRMPAAYGGLIRATYNAPFITFRNICLDSESVAVTVSTLSGINVMSGTFSTYNLSAGIYIGNLESFSVTLSFPDGSVYSGYYSAI